MVSDILPSFSEATVVEKEVSTALCKRREIGEKDDVYRQKAKRKARSQVYKIGSIFESFLF